MGELFVRRKDGSRYAQSTIDFHSQPSVAVPNSNHPVRYRIRGVPYDRDGARQPMMDVLRHHFPMRSKRDHELPLGGDGQLQSMDLLGSIASVVVEFHGSGERIFVDPRFGPLGEGYDRHRGREIRSVGDELSLSRPRLPRRVLGASWEKDRPVTLPQQPGVKSRRRSNAAWGGMTVNVCLVG